MVCRHYPALNFWRAQPSERGRYIYEFADGKKVTILPGMEGVTEVDVRTLHKLDDHEVYVNIKGSRPKLTPAEQAIRRTETGERQDKQWTVSLESIPPQLIDDKVHEAQNDDPYHLSEVNHLETPAERMRELVEKMPPKRQAVYQLAMLNGIPNTRVALMLGVAESTIRYDIEQIKKAFAQDSVLRSYMRDT